VIAVLAGVLVLILAGLAGATWLLFVHPSRSLPRRADAVVVLSGTWETRLLEGIRLVQNGVAPELVFVGRSDSPTATEVCDGTRELRAKVTCLLPNPDTTRTEVREAARLAEREGWRSLVLVTSTFHVTRAELLLDRCFDGKVDSVGTDLPMGIHLTPRILLREWGGLAEAAILQRSC
jgi:uncharacterized SAM-binding protein YcdF (DUF218 family)